jgi:hypothetical protein
VVSWQGARASNSTAKCVICHTNGSYMAYRPALTETLGRPCYALLALAACDALPLASEANQR